MSTYWFELQVGPVHDLDEVADRLYAVCGDGQLAGDERGGLITFSREARNAVEAMLSAIDDAERAGLTVLGATEDLVTVDDIAEKTGRSAAAVGHWITAERGPGGFPEPIVHRSSRIRLYSWAQVSRWLASAGLGSVDQVAAETAAAATDVDALLRARQVLRSAPTAARREALARLIASN